MTEPERTEEPSADAEGTRIYVDADGCPVKDEVYRVAERLGVPVVMVANSRMRVPERDWIRQVVVEDAFDAADDWIAERAGDRDVVITADVPLAARSVGRGAVVVDPRGRMLDDDSIGEAAAGREIATQMREMGLPTRGPAPFTKRDRSKFLQTLDQVLLRIRRS